MLKATSIQKTSSGALPNIGSASRLGVQRALPAGAVAGGSFNGVLPSVAIGRVKLESGGGSDSNIAAGMGTSDILDGPRHSSVDDSHRSMEARIRASMDARRRGVKDEG